MTTIELCAPAAHGPGQVMIMLRSSTCQTHSTTVWTHSNAGKQLEHVRAVLWVVGGWHIPGTSPAHSLAGGCCPPHQQLCSSRGRFSAIVTRRQKLAFGKTFRLHRNALASEIAGSLHGARPVRASTSEVRYI